MVTGCKEKRWPVIIFSRISSLGDTFDVFSLCGAPENAEKYRPGGDNPEPLFLIPSAKADFGVMSPFQKGEPRLLYSSAALAAAKFLTAVRGLPLSDFEIETDGGVFDIIRQGDRCGILLPRFSVCGTLKETVLSADLKTTLLRTPFGKVRVIEVETLDNFCEGLLPELTLSRKGEEIIATVALEKSFSGVGTLSHFCYSKKGSEALITTLAAASYMYSGGAFSEYSVRAGGMVFDVEMRDGGILVSDRHPSPLTLYAPDIE